MTASLSRRWTVGILSIIFITAIVPHAFSQEPFPASLPGGFVKVDSLRTFDIETLYQYVGQDVGMFLATGFNSLKVQHYQTDGDELSIEVFDMGSWKNAFTLFAELRDESADFYSIGPAAYAKEDSAAFFLDRYYVRLNAILGIASSDTLLAAASLVAGELQRLYPGLKAELPPETQFLMVDNLIMSSLRPVDTVMNLDFLGSGYRGRYKFSGKKLTAYLLTYPDTTSVKTAFERFRKEKEFSFMGIRDFGEECQYYSYARGENMSLNFRLGRRLVIITDFSIYRFGADLAGLIDRNIRKRR